MTDIAASDFRQPRRYVRLDTILRLRWLAALCHLAAIFIVAQGRGFDAAILPRRPVRISAPGRRLRLTIALGVLAVACASALGFFHLPLPWDSDDPLVLPPIYLLGVWLSILLAIGVTSLYAFQVTEESRKLSNALAATELVLTREQHLTQIDGLAAAAAHELGTPLSTIFLISRELEKTVHDNDHLAADLKTLREQAQRCRDILAKITQLSSSGAPFARI